MKVARLLIALALACVPSPAQAARAEAWSTVFAAERDTVLFFGTDGTLLMAPFSLATRETLWSAVGEDHLVRLCVSPDGTRAAWIARVSDGDTTRLWVHGPGGTTLRMRYFALQPRHHGYVDSEPDVPTVEDAEARGARLVQAGVRMRRHASNTLAWTPDSRRVIFGYDGGTAAIPADGGTASGVGNVASVRLEGIRPSPLFVVDAIELEDVTHYPELTEKDLAQLWTLANVRVREGRKIERVRRSHLLHPSAGEWQLHAVPGLVRSRVRAASASAIWWAEGDRVRAIRAEDPRPTDELRAPDRIAWLGFDAARRDLLWAAGRGVWRRAEAGGLETPVAGTGSVIRSVLTSRASRSVALVTRDSLLVWDTATDRLRGFRLDGLEPCGIHEGPEGQPIAEVCGSGPPRLARADSVSGRLVEIRTPSVKGGRFHAIGGGRWILLYDPGGRPPLTIQAYDVRNDAWVLVENPGVSGWEPLRPWDRP